MLKRCLQNLKMRLSGGAAAPELALCSARGDDVATCAVLTAVDGAPDWVQLLPAGDVVPNDGRTPWLLPDPAAVVAASAPYLATASVDYDHGTNKTGSSRAAGWIAKLSAEGPHGEPGIWAKVDWTGPGRLALANKEYRFISPVFTFDKVTRAVGRIVRAALTNDPALADLPALASQQSENNPVNDDLKKIAAALGLDPATATMDDVIKAIATLNDNATAMAARKKALCSAAGLPETAKDADVDTAICAKLTTAESAAEAGKPAGAEASALQKQVDDLQKAVALLSADNAGARAKEKVDAAIAAGKITPAQKTWAVDYCSRDPKGFDAFVGSAPAILKSGRIAPAGGKDDASVGLTHEQLAICTAMEIDPKDFQATQTALGAKEE